jgi:hypothetical protein
MRKGTMMTTKREDGAKQPRAEAVDAERKADAALTAAADAAATVDAAADAADDDAVTPVTWRKTAVAAYDAEADALRAKANAVETAEAAKGRRR